MLLSPSRLRVGALAAWLALTLASQGAAQTPDASIALPTDTSSPVCTMDASMTNAETRTRNIAAVHAFLDLLSAKDMDAWADLWAEDAVQDMPFTPTGFPDRVEGRDALIAHYAALPDSTGRMVFVDRVERPMLDPNVVLMEYRGEIEILPTGRDYDNTYAGLFVFDADGRITLFREYFDPNVLSEAWAGAPGDGFGSDD